MSLFVDFEEIVKYDEPLAAYTWFRLGGPAKYFVTPRNKQELLKVLSRCKDNAVNVYVLGRGSNLLVADEGIDGAVIRLTDTHFGQINIDGTTVRAGAGTSLNRLIAASARQGLSGLEFLVGIPGSVGGAVKINAGGRFGDIGSVAKSVDLLDRHGYEFSRPQEDIYFGYRSTNITAKFVMAVEFELTTDDPERIGRSIKEVWMLKKSSQPMDSRNAGCVFKNPRSLSAGALIDKAGLKGVSAGGAKVSDRHANFIVVTDGARSSDVLKLIDIIRERVQKQFEVDLELELELWP